MSKISTVNSQRNSSTNAWARGPPSSSTPSTNISQPAPSQAPAPVSTPTTSTAPSGPRTNGQPSHSRRSSAAFSNSFQPSPSTLKEPVAVGKNVVSPLPAKPNNVTFGSIDDTNATLSTSPAAPSTMADIKQIKSFGSISAAAGDATPPSGSESKIAPPSRTDSPAPAGKVKRKLDVNSLFQKKQAASPAAPASPAAGPTASPRVTPSTIPPAQPQQTPVSQAPPETPSMRPSAIHQSSYDSPSIRNSPLPVVNHPPNQMPSPMAPGPNPNPYHFTPPNMRQGGNAGPGSNPPRSPNISRAMTNGNLRGPPGAPGSGVLGSPRMGPPPSTNAPPATPNVPTPMPGVPPGMMNAPNTPVAHPPPHMPVPSMAPGQMPHMAMPPGAPMWQYYYPHPPHFDPMVQQYYWHAPPPPGHIGAHPPPPGSQQPATIPLPPSGMPTPSTAPMSMPMSPRVPSTGPSSAAPPTPATPHAALAQAPPGQRTSFIAPIASRRPIAIKNSAGEEIDLSKVRAPKPEETQSVQPTKKDETPERRPVSIRMETEDAHKRRIEEEKQKEKEKHRKEEELAKTKAKRDAEARERAKRDQEEKDRRRREAEEAERKKVEEEEKVKREAEEAEQREKEQSKLAEEEKLRKIEEEKERARLEAEEKERAQRQAQEEAEAKRKAEEEAKRIAEEEAKRQEEEEKRRAAEEAKRLEEEAKRKAEEEEKARIEAEAVRKAKEAEDARLAKEKEEQEAAAAAAAAATAATAQSVAPEGASQSSTPAGSTPAYASPAQSSLALPPKSAIPPSFDANKRRPIPGRLDLSATTNASLPQAPPSALASARIIEDIGKVSYPEGIRAPSSELNVNAANGKFRYDRDFLMQFMKVCKEKPDDMPSLDAIGLEPSDQQGSFSGRRGRAPIGGPGSARNSVGLGLNGPGGVPFGGKSFGAGNMGQFQAPSGRSSEERFAASSQRVPSGQVPFPGRPIGRTNSTTGPPMSGPGSRRDTPQRSHSNKGMKRTDSKVGPAPLAMQSFTAPELELHHAENSWSAQRKPINADQNTPEYVDRKVKALLNKLTMEKFDSISKQILEWANRSVHENDGRTLIQVIRLVFEKATDEATWSEMYARLCRFLMERISQDVRDEGIKNADGKPIAGGNLFRKYLLNRCQEDFERGWSAKEAAAVAAAANKADDEKAAAAAEKSGEEVLYSDEYYASQKAKRRGLGLVKFIGELFKLQMLTERIMHECIKKLLSNVENPEEEEIESLCKLLTTVGQALDTPKARNHMDIYFTRMQELANSGQISSRIQFMLIDVIELRQRKWVSRTQAAAPTTIAEVHQKAERDRQVAEREAALRQAGGRDNLRGSRRGDTRDYGPPQVGADGWTTPQRMAAATKVGDMSQFGKISKTTNMQFGPTSVFSKKDKRDSMSSVTRASSSSNMFAALNSSEATPDAVSAGSRTANSTRPPSRKGSIDFGAEPPAQRRRLMLNPRTQNITSDAGSVRDEVASTVDQSETGDDEAASTAASASGQNKAPASMTTDQAKRRVKEDVKELLMLRQVGEAEGYFTGLPVDLRWILVEQLVHHAIDARATDVQLIADVFDMAATKSLVDEDQFLQGFTSDMEYLEDTSTDSPNAYGNAAVLIKAAKLSQDAVEKLADKIIMEGDMAITPREKLLRKYAALSA